MSQPTPPTVARDVRDYQTFERHVVDDLLIDQHGSTLVIAWSSTVHVQGVGVEVPHLLHLDLSNLTRRNIFDVMQAARRAMRQVFGQ